VADCYPLGQAPRTCIEEYIAGPLRSHIATHFPRCARAGVVAEWWLHSRPHTSGHQLHFDTDEQRLRRGQGVHCPQVCCSLLLIGGSSCARASAALIHSQVWP
jgi:hypothetical protein